MIFQEKKTEEGYTYKVEDVFGEIIIESTNRLVKKIKDENGEEKEDGSLLDDMVLLLLRKNLSAGTITGKVLHEIGTVKYTFNRAPTWEEDDEEENKLCENTHTSTSAQVKESIQMFRFLTNIWNWSKRFAAAFREAWKSTKK